MAYLDYGPFQAPTMSASRRAYLHVKERILDGTLPGTALVSEVEIAEELGMSRTPVRAAFGQLEGEGYLKLYPEAAARSSCPSRPRRPRRSSRRAG